MSKFATMLLFAGPRGRQHWLPARRPAPWSLTISRVTHPALPVALVAGRGTVLPDPPVPPIPSALVISTTDAFGAPTQALLDGGGPASAKGIYTPVRSALSYTLGADVRVDRYSDSPAFPTSDWAMQLTFAQTGVSGFDGTPQAGLTPAA